MPETLPSEMRLSWSSTNCEDSSGSSLHWKESVHRFDTIDLAPFVGWRVKDISIYTYEGAPHKYTARIYHGWKDEENHFQAEVIFDSLIANHQQGHWNTIVLDTNIYVPSDCELWIGYLHELENIYYCYPWATDHTPIVQNKGNLERSISNYGQWHYAVGIMGNWCISATIVANEGDSISIGSRPTPQITGFRIYRDGNMIADIPHPEQTFYCDESSSNNWIERDYCVVAVYDDEFESEPLCVTALTTKEFKNEDFVKVYPNPATDRVIVEGESIDEIHVFDNMGRLVGKRLGAGQIDVTGYAKGIYTLKIYASEGQMVKHVSVK